MKRQWVLGCRPRNDGAYPVPLSNSGICLWSDPNIASGALMVGPARVKDVYDRIDAGDRVEDVSDAFGLSPGHVKELATERRRKHLASLL